MRTMPQVQVLQMHAPEPEPVVCPLLRDPMWALSQPLAAITSTNLYVVKHVVVQAILSIRFCRYWYSANTGVNQICHQCLTH